MIHIITFDIQLSAANKLDEEDNFTGKYAWVFSNTGII